MGPVARYSLQRLALFAALLGVGFLTGLRGALLVLGAAVVSGVASWALLGDQRTAMVTALQHRAAARQARAEARAAREDDWDEARRAAERPAP